jgi:hypothetical protein
MFVFSIEKNDIKTFMNRLFVQDTFDRLDIREVKIKTLVAYNIDCTKNNDFADSGTESRFARWGEMRNTVSLLIKGNKRPAYMKLVFSLDEEQLHSVDKNAASAFINIVYENDKVSGYAGSSEKMFSIDKNVESSWDSIVKKFLKKNQIPYV